jgi:hypothetical protein
MKLIEFEEEDESACELDEEEKSKRDLLFELNFTDALCSISRRIANIKYRSFK